MGHDYRFRRQRWHMKDPNYSDKTRNVTRHLCCYCKGKFYEVYMKVSKFKSGNQYEAWVCNECSKDPKKI